MSFAGTAAYVIFDIFFAKAEFAGVVVDELTGTIVVDLCLFVGEGPFDFLCSLLGKERFVNLSLVIQLGSGPEKSAILATICG